MPNKMMKMPTVMRSGHSFARVPSAEIERSTFDRSHAHKTTFDAGYLIPVYVDEALPGDTFNLRMEAFARLATPLKPIMDNLYLDSFFFAVPHRLVWENWQRFNGEQTDPGDSTSFVMPTFTAFQPASLSLSDYMGLPITEQLVGGGITPVSLWHRAYNLIYNEWFRDQNLIDSAHVDVDNGPDSITDYVLRRRGKRHDYFTSALPFPQKGTAVSMPLGSTAPVIPSAAGAYPVFRGVTAASKTLVAQAAAAATPAVLGAGGGGAWTANEPAQWQTTGLATDLTTATAATINQLREAFQIQRLLERDARGGTRYTEIVWAHFRVKSPDARLQRPEYLGGGSSPVIVNPVAQTSVTATDPEDDISPQGNLAAVGTSSIAGHGFSKSFTEHCLLLGLVSVRADLTYQQGTNRMFNRVTRYDHFWPALAHLGEQAVLNREIFTIGGGADQDTNVFGYQERYAEYRYKPSQVTGRFRSQLAAGSLDMWHLCQDFGVTLPTLNQTFIEENPPVGRTMAVPTEPHFLFDSFFKLTCARPMPVFGVPGFIDHF